MADLRRCPRCGRAGTLTCLSAGNTCVIAEPCEQARAEALAQVQAIGGGQR